MHSRKNHLEQLEDRRALSVGPVILARRFESIKEDTRSALHIKVFEPTQHRIQVDIKASGGQVDVGSRSGQTLHLYGTAKDINGLFKSLAYTPAKDSNKAETITVTARDGTKQTQTTVRVGITPVNDPPQISSPNSMPIKEGSIVWSSPLSDPDSKTLRVTLSSADGTVRIEDPRASNQGNRAAITGDISRLNALLSTPGSIRVAPKAGQDQHITIKVSDGKLSTSATLTATNREDLAENAGRAVESRLAGKDPAAAKPIFSIADHANSTYRRNEACWAYGLDLTPISPWNDCAGIFMAGTLVSPRHVVYATHFAMSIGTKIRFVTKDNEVVERTIVNAISPKYTGVYMPDITVAFLDSDVPSSIGFAKVLPENWARYMQDRPDLPCLALDQEEKALVTNLQYLNEYAAFDRPRDQTTRAFYEDIIWGDSGNPAFMIVDDQLVLLTVWTFGYGGSGTSIANQRTEINRMMRELGGGYQLTSVDLGGFRKV